MAKFTVTLWIKEPEVESFKQYLAEQKFDPNKIDTYVSYALSLDGSDGMEFNNNTPEDQKQRAQSLIEAGLKNISCNPPLGESEGDDLKIPAFLKRKIIKKEGEKEMLEFEDKKMNAKLTLIAIGPNEDEVYSYLKEATGLKLANIIAMAESLPKVIFEETELSYAKEVAEKLEKELGAKVKIEKIVEPTPEEQKYQDLVEKIDNLPSDWVTTSDLKWIKRGVLTVIIVLLVILVLVIVK
ncbi:MAG: hypothetical protein PHW31_04445 [Candidatus Pacebacteria bacterium]|nr:hypothetical protein [Candidatus Paceibacterota bacterium]